MSVLVVTSLGDLVVDLHTDRCPLTCKNFLKLCKIKYYNGCLFHTVQKDFTAQTGDPTGTGKGGDSIYKFLYGDQARFFTDEIHLDLKHSKMGTVAMASGGENLNASQFYFTLRDDLDYLDGKHTVFGEVAEGLETLTRINEAYVDEKGRPFKNIRIKHTYILDDPFDDPPQLTDLIPDASPEGKPKDEADDEVRLEDDWVPLDEQLGATELDEIIRTKEAHSSAVVLESIGDIPDAEIKPPENVLFVCKLNPVTEDEDLHTIFSRFGTVVAADIIRDFKTGDSLCYAFIEFETRESCERAYFKMDNALIDDRRIHVDFSQSVAKLWSQYRRKDNKNKGGSGCFKCGALDHMARDCTGGPSDKQQPVNYILKDDSIQHGGDDSRYDMVFDEDAPESPGRRKRHRGSDGGEDKRKTNRRSPEIIKDRKAERDSHDKYRHSERSRHRGDEERTSRDGHGHTERSSRRREDGASGKMGRDYVDERKDRERQDSRRKERDDGRRADEDYGRSLRGDDVDVDRLMDKERQKDSRRGERDDGRRADEDHGRSRRSDADDDRLVNRKHRFRDRSEEDDNDGGRHRKYSSRGNDIRDGDRRSRRGDEHPSRSRGRESSIDRDRRH